MIQYYISVTGYMTWSQSHGHMPQKDIEDFRIITSYYILMVLQTQDLRVGQESESYIEFT